VLNHGLMFAVGDAMAKIATGIGEGARGTFAPREIRRIAARRTIPSLFGALTGGMCADCGRELNSDALDVR
jgi:hypothetical protein